MSYSGYRRFAAARLMLTCAILLVAGCVPSNFVPLSPVAVADRSLVDEKVMIAAEQAYFALGIAISAGASAGLIKGAVATRIDQLDGQAYQAILMMRAAYDTGNAADFDAARREAATAIDLARALLGQAQSSETTVKGH